MIKAHITSIKFNDVAVDIDALTLDNIKKCVNDSDISIVEQREGRLYYQLYGVDLVFKKNKLVAMFVKQSNMEFENKIKFVDSNGNERDIQMEYLILRMTCEQDKSVVVRDMIVRTNTDVDSYDNIGCKFAQGFGWFTLFYDMTANKSVIDSIIEAHRHKINVDNIVNAIVSTH